MMKAIVISIGDELVLGQTIDTNAGWLSERLAELGVAVVEQVTVGDDQAMIAGHLRRAGSSAEVLVVSGGLGPTDDDLTRKALAEVLGVELRLDEGIVKGLEEFFAGLGRGPMPERNRVQAMIPAGCEVLANPVGTAPGMAARIGGAWAFFVPGVPREMKTIYRESIEGRLREILARQGGQGVILTRVLHTFGAGESAVAELLGDGMRRGANPLVNSTVAGGVVSIRINARGADRAAAEAMIGPVEAEVRERLGTLVYGSDEETLGEVVGGLLREKGVTVATAESCTGGLLAKVLTDTAGASEYFRSGWVCYSNEAKERILGVRGEDIGRYGAVSEAVGRQLGERARKLAHTDYGMGITGIAGPGGGSAQKPVGLVYVSLAKESGTEVKRYNYTGSREMVRERAVKGALNLLRLELLK